MATVSPTPIDSPSLPMPDPADRATFGDRMREQLRWQREDAQPGFELLASQTYQNAQAAEDASVAANAAANFKGAWSALSGALNVPAAVYHDGGNWALLNNLADVTASEPGVSADWVEIGGVKRSGDTMTGPLSVPSGASGAQVPQAQEVVPRAGGVALSWHITLPTGATGGQAVRADEAQWSSPVSVSASGSAVDVTGIPSGIRELCVTFGSVGIPANATGALRIGPSTGIVSAGYSSFLSAIVGSTSAVDPDTTSFGLRTNQGSAFTLTGSVVLRRLGNTNSWTANGLLSGSASSRLIFVSGDVTLSGVMDRLRVNLSTGTFSGGTFYISWRY